MFEFHAWLVVRATPRNDIDDECEQAQDREAIRFARAQVDRLVDDPGMSDARSINGVFQVHLAGFTNHRSPDVEDALDVFSRIAREQPGSYGMFYFLDDEQRDMEDRFQVLVARRGEIHEYADPYFSPICPVIEDPLR